MSVGVDATFNNSDTSSDTKGLTHTNTDSSQDTVSKIKRAIATFQQSVTNQANQSASSQASASGTNQSGSSTQNQTGTSNQTSTGTTNSTTVSGSSQESIDTAKANLARANDNYDKAEVNTQPIVDNIVRQAAITFAPTRVQENKNGLFNTSSLTQLQAESEGAATAQAAGVVLNYKTQQQQLATQISGQLLDATKTSSTSGTSSQGTAGISTSAASGTNKNDSLTQTAANSQTAGTQVGSGTTVGTQNEDDQVNTLVNLISKVVTDNQSTTNSNTQAEGVKGGFSVSIICTELAKQCKLSRQERVANFQKFSSYPTWGIAGYYLWAVPAVLHIRKYPSGRLVSFLAKVFQIRARGSKLVNFAVELLCATCGVYLLLTKQEQEVLRKGIQHG